MGAAKGLKQQGKTLIEHLLAWNFTALKALPLLLIDAAVERERLLRGGDAEIPQRADDAVALRFAEVEQGIIKVQKQIADHGSSTFPFSCAQAAADMRRRRNTIRQPAQLSIMTGTPM